jgi:hypothetical protein
LQGLARLELNKAFSGSTIGVSIATMLKIDLASRNGRLATAPASRSGVICSIKTEFRIPEISFDSTTRGKTLE